MDDDGGCDLKLYSAISLVLCSFCPCCRANKNARAYQVTLLGVLCKPAKVAHVCPVEKFGFSVALFALHQPKAWYALRLPDPIAV